jgi:hypothetical protein
MKPIREIITVTKIEGENVSYSGSSMFSGGKIEHFPKEVKVGDRYILESTMIIPSKVLPYENPS